jgi:hypothetical protein
MTGRRLLGGVLLGAALAVFGCRENVTAPGSCPALCPSAQITLVDTVLTGIVTADSTYRGYYGPFEAPVMPLATLDSLHSIALIRFGARDSTWYPDNDTAVTVGAVDSVVLRLELAGRDSTVAPLRILAYRLPSAFDTGLTWSQAQAYLTDSLLIDTVTVPDTLTSGEVRWALRAEGIARLAQPDTGVAALALVLQAPQPTALSVGQSGSVQGGPYLDWYVRAIAPRDTLTHVFSIGAAFDTFVYDPPSATPADALAAGGLPSARSILRLQLPPEVLDSARLVRATLILTPTSRTRGLPGESFRVSARGLVRDLGPKSVLFVDTAAGGTAPVVVGDSAEIPIEIGRLLRAWGTVGGDSLPRVVMLLAEPEGGGMGEVRVARANAGAAAPRLRVTYVRPYPFGVP